MSTTAKGRKLTIEEYIEAVGNHEIYFEGRMTPDTPDQWGDYAGLFHDIRRIGDIKPTEFIAQYDQDDTFIVYIRKVATKLTRGAWHCLNENDTEQGWRKEVEFRAFKPFERDIIWYVLGNTSQDMGM